MSRPATLLLAAMVLFVYMTFEWLFLVTKPSFTAVLTPFGRVSILATGYVVVAAPFLLIVFLTRRFSEHFARLLIAILLGCLLFLLADNFLYTVLGWGTLGTPSSYRFLYTGLLLALVWFADLQLREIKLEKTNWRLVGGVGAFLVVIASVSVVRQAIELRRVASGPAAPILDATGARRPNVLFVGIDGVESTLLSVYGSRLDTTPFLRSTADEWMLFENAFTDAGKTTGATTSMLSGRTPFETHVGFPPQVLLGADSYLHLPALLNREGYVGFQQAIRYYADAFDLNQRDSFQFANGRQKTLPWLDGTVFVQWLNNDLYFLRTLSERLFLRLRYVFYLGEMLNHHLVVKDEKSLGLGYDVAVVEAFETFVEQTEAPFYGHLHFLSTHCCEQAPASRVFDASLLPDRPAEEAQRFAQRLNSLRDADGLIERLYRFLESRSLLDDTILVVYSDHSYVWDSIWRVPLMVRFPEAAHAGRRDDNVLLSMMPALLVEYLGLTKPDWMREGPGLRAPKAGPDDSVDRPLFAISSFKYRRFSLGKGVLSRIEDAGPPNYGVESVSLVLCSRWYKALLDQRALSSGEVHGHSTPCTATSYPSEREVAEIFDAELSRHGYVWGDAR